MELPASLLLQPVLPGTLGDLCILADDLDGGQWRGAADIYRDVGRILPNLQSHAPGLEWIIIRIWSDKDKDWGAYGKLESKCVQAGIRPIEIGDDMSAAMWTREV